IVFAGKQVQGHGPAHFAQLGIARTFQNLRLFRNLTLLDNILIGLHNRVEGSWWTAITRSRRGRLAEQQARERAEAMLQRVGLWERRYDLARSLSYGQQKWLEVARALVAEPRLVLLDEPAAGLNPAEGDRLEAFIRTLPAQGTTVLLIEHDMRLVMRLAECITVLNFGKAIAQGTPADIQANPQVIEAYLGKGRKHAEAR
ncbi:MAG: ATP-binding cassette domain-containing protein, partial [Alicyclobacillus sp.]|nr:ATP-binding cassette domain-containing protein [Alicyclobacillus sp.]